MFYEMTRNYLPNYHFSTVNNPRACTRIENNCKLMADAEEQTANQLVRSAKKILCFAMTTFLVLSSFFYYFLVTETNMLNLGPIVSGGGAVGIPLIAISYAILLCSRKSYHMSRCDFYTTSRLQIMWRYAELIS